MNSLFEKLRRLRRGDVPPRDAHRAIRAEADRLAVRVLPPLYHDAGTGEIAVELAEELVVRIDGVADGDGYYPCVVVEAIPGDPDYADTDRTLDAYELNGYVVAGAAGGDVRVFARLDAAGRFWFMNAHC